MRLLILAKVFINWEMAAVAGLKLLRVSLSSNSQYSTLISYKYGAHHAAYEKSNPLSCVYVFSLSYMSEFLLNSIKDRNSSKTKCICLFPNINVAGYLPN